jgi:putative oxidoreductase
MGPVTTALLLGYSDISVLLLRLAAGGMMITHGLQKMMNYSAMADSFPNPIGIGSNFSFLLIMLTESVGSLFVILGLFTRLAATALVFGMGVAAFIAHAPFTLAGSELPLLYNYTD